MPEAMHPLRRGDRILAIDGTFISEWTEEQVLETTEAYNRVAEEVAKLKPDTIIITSPHSVMYADYFHISPGNEAAGSFRQFMAPEVQFSEMPTERLQLKPSETLNFGVYSYVLFSFFSGKPYR